MSDLPPPRAAYVHVPFCARRCGYCNFTVVAGRDDLVDAYLAALARELSSLAEPRPVATLFVGGGTPTQLPAAALRKLLELIRRWFPPEEGAEFSVEANPSNVDTALVDLLAREGVNRLSLGAQSFDAETLAVLERDHRADQIERAVQLARPRMTSVSLDLIFAAPGQTLEAWRTDLETACRWQPDHLSTYGLTWEKGTAFFGRRARGLLQPADEELERRMYELALDTLPANGWEHYEVSNFARPGHRCRHNEVYWSGGSYYAAGPGASRHVDGWRETNHRSTTTYIRRVLAGEDPVEQRERLAPEDRARERLVLGLRRSVGVDARQFQASTGYALETLEGAAIERLVRQRLLCWNGPRLQLTREGLMVSDSLWPELVRV